MNHFSWCQWGPSTNLILIFKSHHMKVWKTIVLLVSLPSRNDGMFLLLLHCTCCFCPSQTFLSFYQYICKISKIPKTCCWMTCFDCSPEGMLCDQITVRGNLAPKPGRYLKISSLHVVKFLQEEKKKKAFYKSRSPLDWTPPCPLCFRPVIHVLLNWDQQRNTFSF